MPDGTVYKKAGKQRCKSMRVVLFFILLSTLLSCYKRVEGCLDPLSSNFSPNADDACATCCTNPFLRLTLKHQLADTFYNPADSAINDLAQAYKLLDFRYYLSGFRVSGQQGQEITGERSLYFTYLNEKKSTQDNFVFVQPTTFDYVVNEIRQYGLYDSLVFSIGLADSIAGADFPDVEKDHVLSDSTFLRDENNVKSWCTLTLAKGNRFSDTLRLSFGLEEPETKIRVSAPVSNTIGKDLRITVIADYAAWFKTVDLNLPPDQLKEAIRKNLLAAFSVE